MRADNKNVKVIIEQLKKEGLVIPVIDDPIFKNIFRDPEMRGILSFIISKVTGMDEDYVYEHIKFKDSNIGKKNIKFKDNTSDLIVEFGKTIVMLEMNKENDKKTRFRNMSHFHSLIVSSIFVSSEVDDIKEIIQINFDNKIPFSDKLISRIMMRDDDNQLDLDEINYVKYRINLSFLDKKGYNISELTRFEKILLMMREDRKEKLSLLAGEDKELRKMVKKIEDMSSDENIISIYDEERLDKLAQSVMEEEIRQEGIKSGSMNEKKETAKNMLKDNLDIKLISKYTGLSKEEIEKLK